MLTLLGKTILVGWEPSGAVLAVVQKLGGAFLWSAPSPPWGRASLGLASRRAPALPLALTRTLTRTLTPTNLSVKTESVRSGFHPTPHPHPTPTPTPNQVPLQARGYTAVGGYVILLQLQGGAIYNPG